MLIRSSRRRLNVGCAAEIMSLLGHHGAVSKQRNKLVHPLKNKRATHVLLPTMFSNMFESWSTPEVFAGREVTGVSGLASQEEVVCAMRVVSESETRRFLRIRPACHTRNMGADRIKHG
jgi:hypothetical protein